MKIKRLKARTILNSKGEKTIEIIINDKYTASAPTGTSIGKYEVKAFPNSGIPINIVNKTIASNLSGLRVEEFKDLEQVENVLFEYDPNFKKLGGNTIIAIEYALLKAMSNNEVWKTLNPSADIVPRLLGNCVGGGLHFKGESTDFQEFLLSPEAERVKDADFINRKTYARIGEALKATQKTCEGAWVTQNGTEEILKLLNNIIEDAVRKYGIEISLGVDVAANTLFQNNLYHYKNKMRSREEQIKFVNDIISKYDIKYIEDPVMDEDFEGFGEIKGELISADDLVCTSLKRLESAKEYISAVIVKPNQVGSLIKTKKLIDFANENGIITVMSHRSGETMDTTIVDLAVAWEVPYIKCGIAGKERVVKLNRLKNIEIDMR